jgi:hypothetical protein
MTSSTINLHRKEIEEILGVLNKFPEVSNIELHYKTSGIGNCVDIEFTSMLKGVAGKFKVEITGPKDW